MEPADSRGVEEVSVERRLGVAVEKSAARVVVANDRAMIANGQTAAADQQVTDHLAKCAALSTRLAGHGINVPSAPPFYAIPPLTMKAEVDAERTAN